MTLDLGPLREACPLGLAPSTSTTAMLALGDALALVVSRMQAVPAEDFARFHPGGSLGRKLAQGRGGHAARWQQCRVARESQTRARGARRPKPPGPADGRDHAGR